MDRYSIAKCPTHGMTAFNNRTGDCRLCVPTVRHDLDSVTKLTAEHRKNKVKQRRAIEEHQARKNENTV